MKKRESLASGAALLCFVNLFSQSLGFAYRVWLSRLVDAQTLGLFSLIMPVYSVMMSLCVSGFTVAVSRQVAGYTALGNEQAVKRTVRVGLMGCILMTVSFSFCLAPFSDAVSVHLLGDARTRLGLLLLLPCMLLTAWENVHKNYFYGRKNVIPPAISELLEQVTRTAAILGLLYIIRPAGQENSVGLMVLGMIISEVFSASLLTYLFRRSRRKVGLSGVPENGMRGQILRIAAPVALANVCVNLIGSVNSVIIPGRLIVSGVAPSEALSAYGVAFGMTMPLLGLPMALVVAVSLVMIPRVSEAVALKDMAALKSKVKAALMMTSFIVTPMSVFLILYGRKISVALFKNPNAGAYMMPLTIATAFACFEYVLHSLLNGMGRQKQAAANMVAAGIIQLAVTYLAVARPELRLMGFVWAYIAGNIIGTGLNLIDLVKKDKPYRPSPSK